MSQADRILKTEFRKHFTNHEANYPVSRPIELGDYGVIVNGYYSRKGNIRSKGVTFTARPRSTGTSHEAFKSEGSVEVESNVKGTISADGVPIVNASIDLTFNNDKSIFYSSADVHYLEIDNVDDVGNQILNLYDNDQWEKRFVVVTTVIEANNAIIAISGQSGAKAVITADSPAIEEIDLGDASVDFTISATSTVQYDISFNGPCQIGFALSKVHKSLFGNGGFDPHTLAAGPISVEQVFIGTEGAPSSGNVEALGGEETPLSENKHKPKKEPLFFGDVDASDYDSDDENVLETLQNETKAAV